MGESPPVLVIDNGSSLIRAGFNQDYRPTIMTPTIIGKNKYAVSRRSVRQAKKKKKWKEKRNYNFEKWFYGIVTASFLFLIENQKRMQLCFWQFVFKLF